MEEKLQALAQEFQEINEQIVDPEIINDQPKYVRLTRRRAELEPVVELYNTYTEAKSNLAEAKELLNEEKDEEKSERANSRKHEKRFFLNCLYKPGKCLSNCKT